MPDSEAKPASTREPRALSAEYHKARKQLMLWSAILFIWELVGIDLEKAKEAGGNAGAIITAIKSPQAVPWVLLILVGYFLFKCTVEWYQCSSARRTLLVSKIDFTSAWIVPLSAYVLYVYQAMSRVQFADVLASSDKTTSVKYGMTVGMLLTFTFYMAWRQYRVRDNEKFNRGMIAFGMFGLLALGGLLTLRRHSVSWTFVAIGLVSGILAIAVVILVLRPWRAWRLMGNPDFAQKVERLPKKSPPNPTY